MLSQLEERIAAKIMRRAQADIDALAPVAKAWIEKVRQDGDAALVEYIRKFDRPEFSAASLRVSAEDIKAAYATIPTATLEILKRQIAVSKQFHQEQARRLFADAKWEIETIPGVRTGVKKVPLDAVGLYVPAGKAPLPTVAQILTVAAKAAGVPRIVVCFPPTGVHHEIIVAADLAGADEIYRVGGIAAIAALAYGTESIPMVDKICGPGSPYVQAAKLQVFGQVGIDMLSGPSEALIIADETSDPRFLAADLLARCEHGPDSSAVVIVDSEQIARQTAAEVERQKQHLSRSEFIEQALSNGYTAILVADSRQAMIDFANSYAAEHLEIQTHEPEELFSLIRHAGSAFIGQYAPVAVGDYASGTNHCLPTSRAVRFSSPNGVEMFTKNIEFQVLTKAGLQELAPIVETVSGIEGLDAHWQSLALRLQT